MNKNDSKEHQMEKRLLTIKEAAKYMGTDPGTLYKRFRAMGLPFVKLYSNQRGIRFDIKELDKWIDNNKLHS